MESFESRFQSALIERIQKTIGDEIDSTISGHLKFEEYVAKCATIRTLQDILDVITEIRHAMALEATGSQKPSPVVQKFTR